MNSLDEIGNSIVDKSIKVPDDTSPFIDIKTFTTQRQAKQALDAAISNLDVREVIFYLNDGVIEVLNLYKSQNNQSFSDTINSLCDRNLDTLETMCQSNFDKWINAYNDYMIFTNLDKSISNTISKHIFLPAKSVKSKHKNIYVMMSKKNLDRIDKIKSTFIFKNSSRDVIITYLMCINDFSDLPPVFVSAISNMFYNFRFELDGFMNTLSSGSLNVNIATIEYLTINGFLKVDVPLMLRYIKEVVNLCKKKIENEDVLISDYLKLVNHVDKFISVYNPMFDVSDNIVKDYLNDINTTLEKLK